MFDETQLDALDSHLSHALVSYVLSFVIVTEDGEAALDIGDDHILLSDQKGVFTFIQVAAKEAKQQMMADPDLKDVGDLLRSVLHCKECEDVTCPEHPIYHIREELG